MEKILLPEWNKFVVSYAVVDPLWSYDVEPGLLNDPFDVERYSCPLREKILGSLREDLRVVVPL